MQDADGDEIAGVASPAHASQSDAESWLGERWRDLREQSVVQVSLFEDGAPVYGPMPLADA